jgi:cytochrome c oxidase subunit 2
MRVNAYERIWMWVATFLIAAFVIVIVLAAGMQAVHPPSHVETLDPATLDAHPEFGKPGVFEQPDGRIVVVMVAAMFAFAPDPVEVPAGRPVTFRITSSDVLHGFAVAGTNANTMVMPGYVSQFTYTFNKPGEYPIVCNEYCGLMHHAMTAKLVVKERQR